ncbi:hypothetical protein IC757_06615 [Wenzhouxiangella sp. AB-CW3]|uniref:hypothetical protein n=1 Tax=Wenzhouxiangella sp. AB-CW3 TaxID=2771012 RepID=UPI00168AF1BB|nr:hypothetical protein [Wenzhouxiangella sp. AB-CW3]QOC23794.1 hypothetical protein IC757_06615 [Wenzhouxiangella sp. AB-CW3]
MQKNLLVIYGGREGSSAIVSGLGRHTCVSVPIFEHLDRANVKKRYAEGEGLPEVHRGLKSLLCGEPFGDSIFELESLGACDRHVVFKWRPWGNMVKVSEVLLDTNTHVVYLTRRDIVNHNLVRYFSNEVIGGGKGVHHPQFKLKKLSEDDQEAYIEEVRNRMFSVDIGELKNYLKKYVESKSALASKAGVMRERGVPVSLCSYEDFLEDKARFLGRLLSLIGLEFEDAVLASDFKKVNREDIREQVANLGEVEHDREIQGLVEQFSELMFDLEKRLGG